MKMMDHSYDHVHKDIENDRFLYRHDTEDNHQYMDQYKIHIELDKRL